MQPLSVSGEIPDAELLIQIKGLDKLIFGEVVVETPTFGTVLYHPWTKEVIAYALLDPEPRDDGFLYIYTLATNPKFRQRGYGRRVLQALLAHWGTQPLLLRVEKATPHTATTLRLYRKEGFRLTTDPTFVNPRTKDSTVTLIRPLPARTASCIVL